MAGCMSKIVIKELLLSDWSEYRSIRLLSLQDSPQSFGSTYEHEAAFSPDRWKSRLNPSPGSRDSVTLAAVADYSLIGLVSVVRQASASDIASLYQMWVAPQYRGVGVGTALIVRVKTWAVEKGIERLRLSVTTVNAEAVSLYQSVGFNPVGDGELLRAGSDLQAQPMEIKLGACDAWQYATGLTMRRI